MRERDQAERLSFFSDAVFAIAITLLVIEIRVPHLPAMSDAALGHALLGLVPNFVGFIVSFLVIARFWAGHHRLFGLVDRASPAMIRANLGLLMAIAFMPFPTALLSDYASLRAAVGFYTAFLVLVGLANMRLIHVTLRDGVSADAIKHGHDAKALRVSMWSPVVIGGTAFAVGMIAPALGLLVLILIAPLVLLLIGRVAERAAKPAERH